MDRQEIGRRAEAMRLLAPAERDLRVAAGAAAGVVIDGRAQFRARSERASAERCR